VQQVIVLDHFDFVHHDGDDDDRCRDHCAKLSMQPFVRVSIAHVPGFPVEWLDAQHVGLVLDRCDDDDDDHCLNDDALDFGFLVEFDAQLVVVKLDHLDFVRHDGDDDDRYHDHYAKLSTQPFVHQSIAHVLDFQVEWLDARHVELVPDRYDDDGVHCHDDDDVHCHLQLGMKHLRVFDVQVEQQHCA